MREAAMRAVVELGYVANRAAQQLASPAPTFIALFHANDEHPISAALLNGNFTAASRLGL